MMQDAFAKEVEQLLNRGYAKDLPAMQSIGYRHMLGHLNGEWDRETAIAALVRDTRRYAKRQMTWFKNQQQVHWYDIKRADEVSIAIEYFLQNV